MSSSSWTAEDALVYVRECDRWSGIANIAGGLTTYCVACKIQDNSGSHFCSSKHARAVQNWGAYSRESFVHHRALQGQAASEPNWILEQGKIMCAMPDDWARDLIGQMEPQTPPDPVPISQAVRTNALSMHVTAPVLPVVDNVAHSQQVLLTQPVNVSQQVALTQPSMHVSQPANVSRHVALTHPSMHVSQPATLTQRPVNLYDCMSELDAVFVRLATLEAGQEALKAQFERLSSTSSASSAQSSAQTSSAEKAAPCAPRLECGFGFQGGFACAFGAEADGARQRPAPDSGHQVSAGRAGRAAGQAQPIRRTQSDS